ncbi:MAG: Xaa-Pro aminopeptidase [Gammaproteobacteria bacterium]|nr:Xaa-Pro aminopeptidase [Gammaproteobacteria bacterium]
MSIHPLLDKKHFARRRKRLLAQLGPEGIAIVPAATERVRNRDTHYPFRQDSDFRYLTGFDEPDAVLVLAPGHEEGPFILFVHPRDPERERWDGRRSGVEGARKLYGADQAYAIDELDERLPALLAGREPFYAPLDDSHFAQRLLGWLAKVRRQQRAGVKAPAGWLDLAPLVHEMRLFKDEDEAQVLREACQITALAHRRVMQAVRPGLPEYALEAELLYTFRGHGGEPAFPSIVAGGANACILHYTKNRDLLRQGELVLVDAGCEWGGYCGDITRTLPVGGRFSPAARELYAVVLAAQQAAIEAVRPGASWEAPHQAAVRVLTEGLVALGLLKGKVERLLEKEAYKRFYMHRTGHWLGMDVHDVGAYKVDGAWRPLEPGMALTVEPGLYIDDGKDVPKAFRNMGIRIEDDVLVTREGCEVLTVEAPKSIEALEEIVPHV